MKSERISVRDLIGRVRDSAGPDMVQSRKAAEQEARELLDDTAGRMTVDDALELGRRVNRGSWGGKMRSDRFAPAFSPLGMRHITADLDRFNDVVGRLWAGEMSDALAAADEIFRSRSALLHAGRSFPSTLLYLRDITEFCVWHEALDNGLALLTDYPGGTRQGGSDAYLDYCRSVMAFASAWGLQPQELDAILSEAVRERHRAEAEAAAAAVTPTVRREACEFLDDLAANNDKEWFEANRERYRHDLRDPLAAVLQAVADRHLVGLDPALNTTVKSDEVLARITKWAPGVAYYTHLWGAFSRFRKQEDVQLFIFVERDGLRYGLALGSAPAEVRQRLADAIGRWGPEPVRRFLESHRDLRIETDGEPIPSCTAETLRAWAMEGDSDILKSVTRDDPLVGSPDLVDDIGRVLRALHPLAAAAWGDEVELPPILPPEGPLRPIYTMEQLAAETRLSQDTLEVWVDLLRGPKKAALLYGPPGTGKTFVAERLARHVAGPDGETRTVQFHPSFSYEDFIEGLRPEMRDGQLGYAVRPGVFHQFCDAARPKDAPFVFVIDEINRADLSSVLGEVMMLIEYRDRAIQLPYSQRFFSIPHNVVILATMNTADRSLALVDFALRRRFHAIQLAPDRDVLAAYLGPSGQLALEMFDLVQQRVADDDYAPGHTYWMLDDPSPQRLQRLWDYQLRPYLAEFWFEARTRLAELESEVRGLLSREA